VAVTPTPVEAKSAIQDTFAKFFDRKKDETRDDFIRALKESNASAVAGGPAQAVKAELQPLSLNLNIDGRTIAEAMSSALASLHTFPSQAPAADGAGQFYGGDHNYSGN
jgi:hypothetical protein